MVKEPSAPTLDVSPLPTIVIVNPLVLKGRYVPIDDAPLVAPVVTVPVIVPIALDEPAPPVTTLGETDVDPLPLHAVTEMAARKPIGRARW
jgi:hypothetical protein